MAHDRIEHFVDDFDDVTVSGRDDQLWVGGDVALRIAKEIEDEEAEKNEKAAGPFPARNEAERADDQRWQGKFVGVLYHFV